MRTILRLTALAILLVVTALWFFGGLNTGRTQTRVPVPLPPSDAGTGREQVVWEKRFLPGLDFLLVGMIIGGAVFSSSFAFRKN